jgi:hypothetical protein
MKALVYINHDRVVADCPNPRCGYADIMKPGRTTMVCELCKIMSILVWPSNLDELLAELAIRPFEEYRNWIPAGHAFERDGHPGDQTPAELRAEFEYMAKHDPEYQKKIAFMNDRA